MQVNNHYKTVTLDVPDEVLRRIAQGLPEVPGDDALFHPKTATPARLVELALLDYLKLKDRIRA